MGNQVALTLADQIELLERENSALRHKSDSDDTTIHLLKEQYKALSDSVSSIREKARREVELARSQRDHDVQDMQISRDMALVSNHEIEAILTQAAKVITEGLNSRIGNQTPGKMPPGKMPPAPYIHDDRLPTLTVEGLLGKDAA